MAYIPYIDARKKMETISHRAYLGESNKEIAKAMGISTTQVSYYLKRLGVSRPKLPRRDRVPLCVVCRTRPVSDSIPHVCSDRACISTFLDTVECSNRLMTYVDGRMIPVDSDTKVACDIAGKTLFPLPKGVKVCVANDVTRVFSSLADHIRYHAYILLGKPRRPPVPLWVNESELRIYRQATRDLEQRRRNTYSEHPQPERLREAR